MATDSYECSRGIDATAIACTEGITVITVGASATSVKTGRIYFVGPAVQHMELAAVAGAGGGV